MKTLRPGLMLSRLVVLLALGLPIQATAQQVLPDLLEDRWVRVETPNFIILSQDSSRQTLRFAEELENWRQVASYIIQGTPAFPSATVPNYVYLFSDIQAYQQFTLSDEPAFFSPTPRANFMALVAGADMANEIAMHHYVHFLLRNFSDLRLPRWYEEGLAGYIARIKLDGDEPRFERFTERENVAMAEIGASLSMERLLYRDEALASPRVIQIANLKSAALLHYFKHAWEEEGFIDRRAQLARYLELLLEGRNPRFAYDQAFDVTTAELDEELTHYLLTSERPPGTIAIGELGVNADYASGRHEGAELALHLAELALNAGQMANAELLFRTALRQEPGLARAHSGTGDAIRFQEHQGRDQEIARYFEDALEVGPDELTIILDYGEYWESELNACEKTFSPARRRELVDVIETQFTRAVAMAPDNPEANLAMGQLHLFPERDWQDGAAYQRRAFELLPADTFIMEQAAKYAIAAADFDEAELLINELAQPLHFWGEPGWVTDLRERLLRKQRNEPYEECHE